MMTPHYFKVTIEYLREIKGKELKPGYIFWVREGEEFLKCEVDLAWYKTHHDLQRYRKIIEKLSIEKRLFTRRDKAGVDFRDFLMKSDF